MPDSKTEQRRRHERFSFHNAVTLTLEDGRQFQGTVDNMGFGGASMMVSGDPPEIPSGSMGKLRVVFFGRPTDYPCSVVSVHGSKLGIKILRADYQGAPEEMLSVKE
ncbi:MAG: PilZ domain-containing protein [Magnetococcales bacterium]|nr:PilZ domain-containing protein [Magnetococcales bacterium]